MPDLQELRFRYYSDRLGLEPDALRRQLQTSSLRFQLNTVDTIQNREEYISKNSSPSLSSERLCSIELAG